MFQDSTRTAGDVLEIPGFGDAVIRHVRRGRLGSTISRLRLFDDRSFYLKEAQGEAAADLQAEVCRLEWLRDRLPVPMVHPLPDTDSSVRVLLDALPGRPSHLARLSKAKRIEILAMTLRDIHSVATDDCPFRNTLDNELAEAERRLTFGKLDVDAFVRETSGVTPAQALDRLRAKRDIIQETVFTHGDYCLPNVMICRGQLSGVIDWGIAGIADPNRDFMAIFDSIELNLGEGWVDRFCEVYGKPKPDLDRIGYYNLLDRFFAHYKP